MVCFLQGHDKPNPMDILYSSNKVASSSIRCVQAVTNPQGEADHYLCSKPNFILKAF